MGIDLDDFCIIILLWLKIIYRVCWVVSFVLFNFIIIVYYFCFLMFYIILNIECIDCYYIFWNEFFCVKFVLLVYSVILKFIVVKWVIY